MQSIDAGSLMAATLEPWDEPVKEESDEQTEEIEINIEETDEPRVNQQKIMIQQKIFQAKI